MTANFPMTNEEKERFDRMVHERRLKRGWLLHDLVMEEVERWEKLSEDVSLGRTQLNPQFAEAARGKDWE